jgi:hypothetical protein
MAKISQVQECSLLEAAFAFLCKFLIAAWSVLFLSVVLLAIASVLAISLRKRIYSTSFCYSQIYMAEEAYSGIRVQEWLCYECCFVQTLKKNLMFVSHQMPATCSHFSWIICVDFHCMHVKCYKQRSPEPIHIMYFVSLSLSKMKDHLNCYKYRIIWI